MVSTTCMLLTLGSFLGSPVDETPAYEIRYNGQVAAVGRNGEEEPAKTFGLYCLLAKREGGGRDWFYLVDERGAGGWAWPERYGQAPLDSANHVTGTHRARLLYDHNDTLHPLLLRSPLFEFADKLAEGVEWTAGDKRYEVVGSSKVGEHESWRVDIGSGIGTDHSLWVSKKSPLILKVERPLTMGRGDRFMLRMQLESERGVDAAELVKIAPPMQALLQLQNDLKRSENNMRPELTDAQIATTQTAVETLEKSAEGTPFARLIGVISRDAKTQGQRAGDVAELSKRFVGKPAPELTLRSLDNRPIDPAEHKGKIVLLHFWDYRGEPFPAEPYGQIGYLDFLQSRRRKLGVQVYGVAVDSRLAEKEKSSAVTRSVRKLQNFMNLGYTLTLDDGTLLSKLGDPQRLGAKLPLWVLIAPDGTIAEYKVGLYEIRPDEGLKDLDAALVKLIQKNRAADGQK